MAAPAKKKPKKTTPTTVPVFAPNTNFGTSSTASTPATSTTTPLASAASTVSGRLDPNQLPQFGSATTSKHTPIGVPSDYSLHTGVQVPGFAVPGVAMNGGEYQTTPLYYKGDQYKMLPTDGGDLTTLQQILQQANLLKAGAYTLGEPDPATVTAFSKLLATANTAGTTWQDTLAGMQASAAANPPDQKIPPLVIKTATPEDLTPVANNAAQTLLGHNLSDDDLNSFIQSFQALQTKQQQDAYNAHYAQGSVYASDLTGDPADTGQVTDATTSASDAAQGFIKQAHPTDVFVNSLKSQLMGGSGDTGVLDFLGKPGA